MNKPQLITEYRRRFNDCLNIAGTIIDTLDANPETMEAQTRDGYTISEDVSLRLIELQSQLSNLATYLCKELIDYAREVREEYE